MNNQSILVENVPNDWVIKKIKYVFDERKETNDPIQTNVLVSLTHDRGVILHSEKGDIGNKEKDDIKKYKIVHPGDIVVNSMNVIIGSSGLSDYFGLVSPVYYMLVKKDPNHDNKFFHYLFRSVVFQKSLIGVGNGILEHRMRVPIDKLGGHLIPLPSANEQKLISRYLDKKTSQIDSLVEKIQKKIELLKEQRTSLISHYVTKGLDPKVEMKDTGIEWIGEIPKNWSVRRLKYHLTPREERSQDGTEELLSVTINPGVIRRRDYLGNDEDHISRAESLVGYKVVKKNDLVNNIMKMSFCCLGISDFDGIVSPAYSVFSLDEEILVPRYLHELLRTPSYIAEYRRRSKGIQESRMRLYDDYFLDISIAVPPKEEQILILEKILKSESSSIFEKENSRLLLLKEYRQSLISSVVTGKVRVTEDMI